MNEERKADKHSNRAVHGPTAAAPISLNQGVVEEGAAHRGCPNSPQPITSPSTKPQATMPPTFSHAAHVLRAARTVVAAFD